MTPRGLPFAAVRDAAHAIRDQLVPRWVPEGKRRSNEWVAKNPTRADNKAGSFQINLKTCRWADFATGDKGGDLISLYAYLFRLSQAEACRELAAELGIDASRPPPRRAVVSPGPPENADRLEAKPDADARKWAQQIWLEAGPIAGSVAEAYLRGRGLTVPLPRTLRFQPQLMHKASGKRWPAMIGAMQVGRELAAVHRTWLGPDARKAPVDGNKMMLGPSRGAAIRLSPPGPAMIIAEGIETSLSALQLAPGWTVWAAGSAGNIPAVTIPPGVKRLVIVADPDRKPPRELRARGSTDPRAYERVGLREAEKAIGPLRGLGIYAEIVKLPGNRDLNDVLQDDPVTARRFAEAMAARLRELGA